MTAMTFLSSSWRSFTSSARLIPRRVDRIGYFLNLMKSRTVYCRAQAARLSERACTAENKGRENQKYGSLFLRSRGLRKIEGREFTLRVQKNSQDSVVISDEQEVPLRLCEIEAKIPGQLWQELLSKLPEEDACELKACVRQMKPSNKAIQIAAAMQVSVPGAEIRCGFICVSPESRSPLPSSLKS
jgi:Siphovirus Gp157